MLPTLSFVVFFFLSFFFHFAKTNTNPTHTCTVSDFCRQGLDSFSRVALAWILITGLVAKSLFVVASETRRRRGESQSHTFLDEYRTS